MSKKAVDGNVYVFAVNNGETVTRFPRTYGEYHALEPREKKWIPLPLVEDYDFLGIQEVDAPQREEQKEEREEQEKEEEKVEVPTKDNTVPEIQRWLEQEEIEFKSSLTKDELLDLVEENTDTDE